MSVWVVGLKNKNNFFMMRDLLNRLSMWLWKLLKHPPEKPTSLLLTSSEINSSL
jgi:hypothetical protein